LHWMLFQTPLKGLLERIQNSFLEALLKVMGKKKGEG
jgi:hypothetical protein